MCCGEMLYVANTTFSMIHSSLTDCSEKQKASSIVLKDIIGLVQEDEVIANAFNLGLLCIVGNGQRIKFWSDLWHDAAGLKSHFPHLSALASEKTSKLKGVRDWNLEQWSFKVDNSFHSRKFKKFYSSHFCIPSKVVFKRA